MLLGEAEGVGIEICRLSSIVRWIGEAVGYEIKPSDLFMRMKRRPIIGVGDRVIPNNQKHFPEETC